MAGLGAPELVIAGVAMAGFGLIPALLARRNGRPLWRWWPIGAGSSLGGGPGLLAATVAAATRRPGGAAKARGGRRS